MRSLDTLATIKRDLLAELLTTTGIDTFIETGTAGATTLESALEVGYQHVISIELHDGFYRMAAQRFLHDSRVRVLHGNSSTILQDVLTVTDKPAIILLDAHYTGGSDDVRGEDGDTPIVAEVNHLIHQPVKHYVLIDDARLFGVDPAYPEINWIAQRFASAGYPEPILLDDIIRFIPSA